MSDAGSAAIAAGVPIATTVPPCRPGARAEIDDEIGGGDRLLVVLDDEHGVAALDAASRATSSSRALSRGCRPIVGSSST